jgi:hypothetical protein
LIFLAMTAQAIRAILFAKPHFCANAPFGPEAVHQRISSNRIVSSGSIEGRPIMAYRGAISFRTKPVSSY